MSSTGPGSVLVFLSFVILSSLLFGIYMTAYLGTIYAGEEVGKKGEAASEQAVIYLFQHPTNVSIVDGSLVPKGETRIVVQNVGPREISFDRILAIGKNGDVLADVKVPGNKGLGARQWQMYKVQDLGLPERWNNFTVFQSEVSRLVLLSERGRTHGSIWGVPPFLEGIFRATISTTTTTSYIHNYIETTSYATTFTITIQAKQSAYSLTGEWWESNDRRNWYKVTNVAERTEGATFFGDYGCSYYQCRNSYYSRQTPTWSEVVSNMKANGEQIVSPPTPPTIKYFKDGSQVTVMTEITLYNITWSRTQCFESCVCLEWYNPYTYSCKNWYCECGQRISEGGATYRFQAIELVDWDTGEVYASINQSSFTFNINRNTIVRFKYVLVSSWSRTWEIVPPLQPPHPPPPNRCEEILTTKQPPDPEWCECAKHYLPPAEYEGKCPVNPPAFRLCLHVSVEPCCTGDVKTACLNSWSASGGRDCKSAPQGVSVQLTASWSASWSLKPGWAFDDWGWNGDANCSNGSAGGNSGSGSCTVTAQAGPNGGQNYYATIFIIFKRTQ